MTAPLPSSPIDFADRAAGAIVGSFIGDALGVGPHWYYDLAELRRDHGPWITGYTTPRDGRYHAGLAAGDLSQAGWIERILLESIVDRGGYEADDFTRRIDEEFFPLLDGSPQGGPGGWTSQSIRHAYARRIGKGLDWGELAGPADTTEAIERAIPLAVLAAADPRGGAEAVAAHVALTHADRSVAALSLTYSALLAALVRGVPFDGNISAYLSGLARDGTLPFGTFRTEPTGPGPNGFPSPDALSQPGAAARLAADPDIRIEPASRIAEVHGLNCAIYHVLPGVYYLAARFRGDFENAVLHAVNGGGQNAARAQLVGALAGAQAGLSGIPARLIEGLAGGDAIVALATRLAALAIDRAAAPAIAAE